MTTANDRQDPSDGPDERERDAGAIAGTAWILGLVLGAGSYSLTSGALQLVLTALFATVWIVAGAWWLWLFFERTKRSYQQGRTGS